MGNKDMGGGYVMCAVSTNKVITCCIVIVEVSPVEKS